MPAFEHVLKRLSGTVEVLVIKEHDLREQDRLLVALLSLTLAAHVQHGDAWPSLRIGPCRCRHVMVMNG